LQFGLLQGRSIANSKLRGKSEEDIKIDNLTADDKKKSVIAEPLAHSKNFKQIFVVDK